MTSNRSLDEFVAPADETGEVADRSDGGPADGGTVATNDGDAVAETEAGAPGGGSGVGTAGSDGRSKVSPATGTYVWAPDGGPCAACGGTVEARWRDGDELVCEACKEW